MALSCMTRRLIEYSAVMVRIPARIPGIFIFVFKKPVINPQSIPPISEKINVRKGFIPLSVRMAEIAPPVANEPSTVRSGKSRIRKVM